MFFRAGGLARLEDLREEKLTDWVVKVQAVSRGYLGRKNLQKLKVSESCCLLHDSLYHKHTPVLNGPFPGLPG